MNLLDFFSIDEYRKFLKAWFAGIPSEINFWSKYIFYNKDTLFKEKDFEFEEFINAKNTKFLDVGSGPSSCVGTRTRKTNLKFFAVDPLAHIYELIKKENNLNTIINPTFAMVECLNEKFTENEFDIVHMRNALDHSFNPIYGILQMLYVVNIGGKVILRHIENEALAQNYQGFHQWNLCATENDYIIWRQNIKIKLSEFLNSIADVEIQEEENNIIRVILTKKNSFTLPENPYKYDFSELFMSEYINLLCKMPKQKSVNKLSKTLMLIKSIIS